MTTFRYRVIQPLFAPPIDGEVEWKGEPKLDQLRRVVLPLLPGAEEMEHVLVTASFGGDLMQARDMFVDEMGVLKGLIRNKAATEIYRTAWLRQHPEDDPDSLPWIAGNAVLFEHRVWS